MFTNNPHQKYSLFISTVYENPLDERSGTAEVDYAKTLADAIHAGGKSVCCMRGFLTEQSVYEYVWANTDSENPTLHIMMNPPWTGSAFSPAGLKEFKELGGKVVVTVMEVNIHHEDNTTLKSTLAVLKEADNIIFLDASDKENAIKFQLNNDPLNTRLKMLLQAASVIPAHPTIGRISNELNERGGDILFFGSIRAGKGLAHVIKLANLIKSSTDPAVNQKKILVVGTLQEHYPRNRELHKLMTAIYPERKEEINSKNIHDLKDFLKRCVRYEGERPSHLPIELHLDVPQEKLAPLFNRCRYAFLPTEATLRRSSIGVLLAQPFVVYSYQSWNTDETLQSSGEYADSVRLLVNEKTEKNLWDFLADRALEDIAKREKDLGLNQVTFAAADKLINTLFPLNNITNSHLEVYDGLSVDRLPLEEERNIALEAFQGDGTARNSSHLDFKTWYATEVCHYLLQMVPNQAQCVRVLFQEGDGNNTDTFGQQVIDLITLGDVLGKNSLFIAKEPGASIHIIVGLVKGNNVLFINPLGAAFHDEFYSTLGSLQKKGLLGNVFVSNQTLQKRVYEEDNLYSCGPISAEIAIHVLSQLTESELNNFWSEKLQAVKPIIHESSGLVYSEITIERLLSPTCLALSNANTQEDYRQKAIELRKNHANLLKRLPGELALAKKQSVKHFLNDCKNNALSQVVFNKLFLKDVTLVTLQDLLEYKHLEVALNLKVTAKSVFSISGTSSSSSSSSSAATKKMIAKPKQSASVPLIAKKAINSENVKKAKKIIDRSVFNWISGIEIKRSDDLMKEMKNLDVRALGEKNYQALLGRLKNLEGPLSVATKDFMIKNKPTGEVLTREEKQFLKIVMGGDWVIKHVTPWLEEIEKAGYVMRSVKEREIKTQKEVDNSHTNQTEGHYDNVFFSIGPGRDLPTVRFLDDERDVIVGDYKVLATQENTSLKGSWFSDHFYAYSTQQDGERVRIYGAEYNVNYRLVAGEGKNPARWVKACEFKHPDGQVYTQTIEMGGEIFTFPRLDIAMVLMTIEKIRLLGVDVWQKIMQESNMSILQNIVQTIYHTGVCEIHKPRRFYIGKGKPGIAIERKETIPHTYGGSHLKIEDHTVLWDDKDSEKLVKDLLKGKTKDAIEAVEAGKITLDKPIGLTRNMANMAQENIGSFTLMGAALFSGDTACIKVLLNKGVNLSTACIQFRLANFNSYCDSALDPIQCLAAISDKEIFKTILGLIFKNEALDEVELEARFQKIPDILKLILEKKCASKKDPNVSLLTAVDEYSFRTMVSNGKPLASVIKMILDYSSIPVKKLPIINASRMGSLEMVRDMLERGTDVNTTNSFHISGNYNGIYLPSGTFPLLAAVFEGNLAICTLLVEKGASIDKPLCISMNSGSGPLCKENGYTALLLAVKLKKVDIVRFLLSEKADITHRAVNGHTVFTLAEENKNDEISTLLENFARERISDNTITEAELALLKKMPEQSTQIEINHHHLYYSVLSGINQLGERCFFMIDAEPQFARETLLFLNRNRKTSIEELTESLLDICNEELALGVLENDFNCLQLGSFVLEVPENKVTQRSTIVSFELNPSHVSQLLNKLQTFPEAIVITARELKSLLLQDKGLVTVKSGEISKLALSILNVIGDMGNTIHAFSGHEQAILERQYQADYQRQYDLVKAAKKGSLKDIKKLLTEGALINQKTFSEGMWQTVTPFEASILGGQYPCALFILNNIMSGGRREERFGPYLQNYSAMEKIVSNGQFEIYKILHQLKFQNIANNREQHLELLAATSHFDFFKYIFNDAAGTIAKSSGFQPSAFQVSANKWLTIAASHSESSSPEMVRFFVSYASKDGVNEAFRTLINHQKPDNKMIELFLVEFPLDPLRYNDFNKTLLLTVSMGRLDLVKRVLQIGQDSNGVLELTTLEKSSECADKDIFDCILQYGLAKIPGFQEKIDDWLEGVYSAAQKKPIEKIRTFALVASPQGVNDLFKKLLNNYRDVRVGCNKNDLFEVLLLDSRLELGDSNFSINIFSWVLTMNRLDLLNLKKWPISENKTSEVENRFRDGLGGRYIWSFNQSPTELIECFMSNEAERSLLIPYLKILIEKRQFWPVKDLIYGLCGKNEVIRSKLDVLIGGAFGQPEVLAFLTAWQKGTVEFLVPAILPSQQSSSSASSTITAVANVSVTGTVETNNKGFENNFI